MGECSVWTCLESMGKRTPSWKAAANANEAKMEEIAQKATGGSENKILLGVLAFVVVVAAAGYQYNLAGAPTQRELEIQKQKMLRGESLGGAEREKVEGVDQDKHGFTSMHRAAEKGVDAVRALLPDQRKALNVTDDWNESPLTKAA